MRDFQKCQSETYRNSETQKHRSFGVIKVKECGHDVVEGQVVESRTLQSAAAIETRSSTAKVEKYRTLKIAELPDLKFTPNEIQKLHEDVDTLNKYRGLAKHESEEGRNSDEIKFVKRTDLLYRKYREVLKDEAKLQLMVPKPLRDKAVQCTLFTYVSTFRHQENIR